MAIKGTAIKSASGKTLRLEHTVDGNLDGSSDQYVYHRGVPVGVIRTAADGAVAYALRPARTFGGRWQTPVPVDSHDAAVTAIRTAL